MTVPAIPWRLAKAASRPPQTVQSVRPPLASRTTLPGGTSSTYSAAGPQTPGSTGSKRIG